MKLHTSFALVFFFLAHPRAQLHASDPGGCGGDLPHLPGLGIALQALESDFPPGSAYADALAHVAASWSNTRSKAYIQLAWADDGDPESGNGVSEVYWVDNLASPAVTLLWSGPPQCVTVEADVLFVDYYDYSASDDPSDLNAYDGSHYSFAAVAMHEFGHVLGIGHRHDVYNVMGDANTHLHLNDGIVTAYPGEWGIERSAQIYGEKNGSYEDLGVAHWKRTGSYGQYSLHGRTLVSAANGPGVVTVDWGDVVYEVEIGQSVRVETTLENFGKNSKEVRVGYYLSSNDHLSTQDRFLGSHVKTINPDVPTTLLSPALQIPADLEDETDYWIGAIVDDLKQVPELDEWNNRASIRIRTRELPRNVVAVAIAGPDKKKAGTSTFVSSIVENHGGGFVPGFTYEIRLSTNTTITSADRLVATFEADELGFKLDEVTIPANLAVGDYYWGLRVLPVSGESTTTDNTVAGNKVKISKGDPDLVAYGIASPPTFEVGDKVQIQCAIANEGGLSMGPYTYRIYLSQDSAVEPTDILLKSVTTFTLGTKIVNVTIPPLPAIGNYRIGMILDPTFGEKDLTDNTLHGGIVIVTSIDGTPDDVTGG